jgi:hypothetical protein
VEPLSAKKGALYRCTANDNPCVRLSGTIATGMHYVCFLRSDERCFVGVIVMFLFLAKISEQIRRQECDRVSSGNYR